MSALRKHAGSVIVLSARFLSPVLLTRVLNYLLAANARLGAKLLRLRTEAYLSVLLYAAV